MVKPLEPIPQFVEKLTGITNEMVEIAPLLNDILPQYIEFLGCDILVGHNVTFDIRFLSKAVQRLNGDVLHNDYVDTLRISRKLISDVDNHKLATIANYFDIKPHGEHRGLDDCGTTNEIFMKLKGLNVAKENSIVDTLDNIEKVLINKNVVFKGSTSLCRYDTYVDICNKASGHATTVFYADKTDYVVFGNTTYNKYLRGDYSEKMIKAIKLEQEGKLKILSEEQFMSLLGVDISTDTAKKKHGHIDTKSMTAQTSSFDSTHPLFGKVCVFTGTLDKMPRKEAMQAVLNVGGEIGNGVTQKTNYLILGCNDYCTQIKGNKSNKLKKAEDLKLQGFDIDIIDELTFYDMLDC